MKTFFAGTCLLLLALSCKTQEAPGDFDYGHVKDNHYVNAYFNCDIPLPPAWEVQSRESMEQMTERGKKLFAGEEDKLNAIVKASEVNTANLLAVFQHKPGAAVEFNPNMMFIAENLKSSPGIKTGSDYLFHSRRLLEQSQFKYDYLDKEFEKEVIDGVDFYKMRTEINYAGMTINQVYYTAVLKGFSFNAIISFINESQHEDLLRSIQSMRFR